MSDEIKTLFLAWQDKKQRRLWYPIGRLDIACTRPKYTFAYTQGTKDAERECYLEPLFGFPDFYRKYKSDALFPLFANRVMNGQRKSFGEYLERLDIKGAHPEPWELLEVDGGYRVTDNFHVFPKIEKQPDDTFRCRFFLHGWRHLNAHAQARIGHLQAGEQLNIAIELDNPVTGTAIQIKTEGDSQMIGWAPRYLIHDLTQAGQVMKNVGDYRAHVIKLNPVPPPSKQRVLIELHGRFPRDYQPMSAREYQLLKEKKIRRPAWLGGVTPQPRAIYRRQPQTR